MKKKTIHMPLDRKDILFLKAGEQVFLSGVIYTARDQAHLRMANMIKEGKGLPLSLERETIYYAGPTPSHGGKIGSCGPTTSSRMDVFTPALLKKGLKGMIGKGKRSKVVRDAIKSSGAVYFVAPAGAGAYLSTKIKSMEPVAFEDLGPEAIYRLTVEDFPVIVAIDARGGDIYERLSEGK